MAKKRIINKGRTPIRNAHLIGKGGKNINPVKGSWVKGYNKAMGKPKVKTAPVKATSFKSKVGRVPKATKGFAKKIHVTKVKASLANKTKPAHKIMRLNPNIKRAVPRKPSPQITMKTRKPKPKPPSRGR